jgi:hypothetical protein
VKRIAWIGVVLIVLGLAGFLVPRIVYSSEETVIDAGPIEVEAEERNAIRIPDVAAGAAVVAGVVLVVAGASRGR